MSMLLVAMFLVIVSCNKDDDNNKVPVKSSDKEITAFSFLAGDNDGLSKDIKASIDSKAKTIKAELPTGTTLTKLKPTITVSEDANVSPKSKVITDFTKAIVYTVTAEDETTSKYTVTITATKNNE
ncbi:DUF5018 domain-containing protein [Arenibacter palladensis]|nr:hypothetical protein [Arenibacter palladensis]